MDHVDYWLCLFQRRAFNLILKPVDWISILCYGGKNLSGFYDYLIDWWLFVIQKLLRIGR